MRPVAQGHTACGGGGDPSQAVPPVLKPLGPPVAGLHPHYPSPVSLTLGRLTAAWPRRDGARPGAERVNSSAALGRPPGAPANGRAPR